jgi:hypothetical protein
MLEELKDLERIIGSKIFSANIQLDDKYGKVFETKIYRENNEISIDEPHAYLGTINDEHISVIKEFFRIFLNNHKVLHLIIYQKSFGGMIKS